ncbi:ROK family protein [Clostridium swellfunianum]|uniref:ROK family protein n=1 Tax=Clostridium swellfunianum TaxID=1367462 RepID=UPI00202F6855|nr:ROK family protein [Clostridium swellfunianum]MCM0647568.1 ROK family protein [Clostridium swellfunianum]
MKNIACFDVGGTFIKLAIINSNGEILYKNKFSTPLINCRKTIPEAIISQTKELLKEYEIDSLGISTAGVVDSDKGEIISASGNLPGYTGAKLSEVISKELNINVYVENDVNSAALGEMWKGAAIGSDTFLCLTLGTGVGGAIVINNKIYKGIGSGAGELGHMILVENGEDCNCGSFGCYERYASTSAFIRMYLRGADSQGLKVENITGEEIMDKVFAKEELACKVYDEFLNHVVNGLVSLTHILDPGLIVIGGGISAQGDAFFKEINNRFQTKVMKAYASHTKIVQAKLNNDAGIYGACYIALKNQKQEVKINA